MEKEQFIKEKIKKLKSEGYSNAQSYAIANSMFNKMQQGGEKKDYYQMAGQYMDTRQKLDMYSNPMDFSIHNPAQPQQNYYDNNNPMFMTQGREQIQPLPTLTPAGINTTIPKIQTDTEIPQPTENNKSNNNIHYNDRVNIMNDPFGGVSMEYALNTAGAGFGSGNYGQAAAGTGLSLIKGVRNFMGGYARGKETQRVGQEMMDRRFEDDRLFNWAQQGRKFTKQQEEKIQKLVEKEDIFGNFPNIEKEDFFEYGQPADYIRHSMYGYNNDPNPNLEEQILEEARRRILENKAKRNNEIKTLKKSDSYIDNIKGYAKDWLGFQQGGKMRIADVISKNAETDQGQGNIEVEDGEYKKDAMTGQIMPIVGEKHQENGKYKGGVKIEAKEGDKFLADYGKAPKEVVSEFSDTFGVKAKKGSSYAELLKTLEKGIGQTKLEKEKADKIIALEKAQKTEDKATKELNINSIQKAIAKTNEKINTLSGVRDEAFEFLFNKQESYPKKGDGNQLLDDNGNPIDTNEMVAQQGKIIPSDLPDPVNGIVYEPEGRTYYDSRMDRIVLTPSSAFAPKQAVINHEKFHKYQFDNGRSNYDITHAPENSFWARIQKKPQLPTTDEVYDNYHNRKQIESIIDIENLKERNPSFNFIPDQILYDKIVDKQQYENPYSLEGEATQYERSLNKQQGGMIGELAKKHNIPLERAMQLMQEGGMMMPQEQQMAQEQGGQEEQIMQMVAQLLQQGASPEEVVQQLVSQGVPQEMAIQAVEMIMQQSQGQEQMMPQEQAPMQQGGKIYAQEGWRAKLNKDRKYGRDAEKDYVDGAFEEPNYDYESIPKIADRFKFLASQRDIKYDDLDLTTREGVDKLASRTQQWDKTNLPNLAQDYGMNVGLTKQGIDHFIKSPVFDKLQKSNPELAKKLQGAKRGTYEVSEFNADDRDTIMGLVKESGDKTFAEKNYLDNKAFFRGIDKQNIYFTDPKELEDWKKDKGNAIDKYYKTDKKGVYVKPILLQPKEFKTEKEKQDWVEKYGKNKEGLHGDFMAEDPNVDTYYTPFAPGETPKETPVNLQQFPDQPATEVRDRVRNILPNLPTYMPMISPLDPLAKQNVWANRLDPIKMTPEPMLAENARQYDTEMERLQQTGLSAQQMVGMSAQGLAASQLAANDAISKVEGFNAQSQQQADLQNLNLALKEQIMNNQANSVYQDQSLAGINNYRDSLNNAYKENFLQNAKNRQDIANMNLINSRSNQFAVTFNGIEYLNNKEQNPLQLTPEQKQFIDGLPPQQRALWSKAFAQKYGTA